MTAVKKDLYIEQGATFVLSFTWHQQGPVVDGVVTPGDPYDLTGWHARMQIRKKQGDPALVDADDTTGTPPKITLGGAAGTINVKLTDEDTDLLNTKSAMYDLEVEDPNGNVFRLLQGAVTVNPNITQTASDPVVGG